MQATAFLRMLPLDLRDKVLSQDGVEGDFERIRDYVLNQVGRHTAESKTTRYTGAAPMDCSSLEHSEDVPEPAAANWFNNGKNRPGSFQTRTGKGGSGGKSSRCVGCGSNEHNADDCPRLTGKGPQATRCFNCHGYGHRAAQCPSHRTKGTGKGDKTRRTANWMNGKEEEEDGQSMPGGSATSAGEHEVGEESFFQSGRILV